VCRFIAANPGRIALVARSDPYRPAQGGALGQAWRHLRRSGPRFLPYLLANFVIPELFPSRLAALCGRLGIACPVVADMNAASFHARLAASGADMLLTFHCDQILTAATIATLERGGLNVHAGLLPLHRGPVPTIHALLEPAPRFGVTIHRLVPRIDAGAILAQSAPELPAGISAIEAAIRLHDAAIPMLGDLLDRLAQGPVPERLFAPGRYCGFPTPAELRALGRRAAGWRDFLPRRENG
jgi:hypothetical protein